MGAEASARLHAELGAILKTILTAASSGKRRSQKGKLCAPAKNHAGLNPTLTISQQGVLIRDSKFDILRFETFPPRLGSRILPSFRRDRERGNFELFARSISSPDSWFPEVKVEIGKVYAVSAIFPLWEIIRADRFEHHWCPRRSCRMWPCLAKGYFGPYLLGRKGENVGLRGTTPLQPMN